MQEEFLKNLYDLTGKTALVTGASSGLGRRFCQVLAQAGATVIGIARNEERLAELHQEIEALGGICHVHALDITDKAYRGPVVSTILENHKIDILVNCAGVAKLSPIFEEVTDPFENIIETNLTALWWLTKKIACHMRDHQIPGSIINIASINGKNLPAYEGSAYSVAKAAVIHLTRQLVGELSPHNIRINAIAPGWIRTPMSSKKLDDAGDEALKIVPLGFIGEVEDFDATLLLLASNKASRYMTGSTIELDGGSSWGGKI